MTRFLRFRATRIIPELPEDGSEGRPRLVSIAEVAAMQGVDVRHLRRLVFDERIPYDKLGLLLHFDPAEIREWLQQYQHRPRRGA